MLSRLEAAALALKGEALSSSRRDVYRKDLSRR
jgi:hypothetical protein